MELTYRTEGDYRVPNLTVPEEVFAAPPTGANPAPAGNPCGKYALLRKKYLRENRRILFVNLLTAGTLNEHLAEIEQAAGDMLEMITRRTAEREGVTEALKSQDQMKWVGLMNNIRHRAEETILQDLIYA